MKLEIVRDFDNTYYCNLKNMSEYISLEQLKKELKSKHDIILKSLGSLETLKVGRKTYFYQEV